ncbi:MAG: carbohydrate-binding family 9-like protein [Acidobacteriia bacterium]|nr:carbohydrate-binding family 9-like protein [Terriglobia bacterium]
MKKCLLFCSLIACCAQSPAVFPSYRAAQDHEPDPSPGSSFWRAKGVALDKSILGQPEPALASEARSRWTDKNLYFLFFGPYQVLHLKPDPDTVHETFKLWFFDDFELYLGANFDNINLYGEFQISPQSEFLDQAIDATKSKPGWGDEHLWDSGMQVKSRIDRVRKIWYGEMRIPIAAIDKRKPAEGNEMRVNVYRLQTVPEGEPKIHFLAWQPTGEWNPHRPAKFGRLKLVGAP